MVNLDIIFSVCIGGVLTLIGTLLANYLQFRSEEHRRKNEVTKERLAEVRRYLEICLEYADMVSIPTTLGPEHFGKRSFDEWITHMRKHLEKWETLPISGSARVLYTNDKIILEGLSKIDKLRLVFYANYLNMIDKGQMVHLKDQLEELKNDAKTVGKRLDELLEK